MRYLVLMEANVTPSALYSSRARRCLLLGPDIYDYQVHNPGNGTQIPCITFDRAVVCYLDSFYVNDMYKGWDRPDLTPPLADGILFSDDCQGCKVVKSVIGRPLYCGVRFMQPTATRPAPSFCELISVDVDQSLYHGIMFESANFCSMIGGMITSCGVHGVVLHSGRGNKVQDATIRKCSHQGIQVDSGVGDFILSGNKIEACTDSAILVSAGASDNYIITSNNCAIGNNGGIVDQGTGQNKYVAGNIWR